MTTAVGIANSVRSALRGAANADGIVAAVARAVWLREHGEECPAGFVPSLEILSRWMFADSPGDRDSALRADAEKQSRKALGQLFGGSWTWSRPGQGVRKGGRRRKGKDAPRTASLLLAAADGPNGRTETLEGVHSAWLAGSRAAEGERRTHPLAPLVRAWQARPQLRVEPDRKENAIMPAKLGGIRDLRELPGEWQVPDAAGPIAKEDWPELGLEPLDGLEPVLPVLPLVIFDASGGVSTSRGRGAALPLRLFLEIVMAVPADARGSRLDLAIRVADLIPWLWPTMEGRESSYRPARQGAMLREAIETLNRIAVPVPGRHGPEYPNFWSCVLVRRRPGYLGLDSEDELLLDVRLPEGSGSGPLVHRPTLRRWGVRSAPAYRAALGLAYYWNRYLTLDGRRLPPIVPEVKRNREGHLLGADGEVLRLKDDRPVTHWADRRAVRTGGFLRNPEMDRLPWLSPRNVLLLCAPEAAMENANTRRRTLQDARKALRAMETAGDLRIEEAPFGPRASAIRILPPDWWGRRPPGPTLSAN